MCIAVVKPAGKWLRRKAARNCFLANRDGAGFAWTDGDKVYVKKGYFSFRKFWNDFREVQDYPCLVHFRIKTHGPVNAENCHPFFVADDLALIHNGTLRCVTSTSGHSDTAVFADKVMAPLVDSYGLSVLEHPVMLPMLENVIGSGNKVAFLNRDGEFTILNESCGNWAEGIWWSNSSWKRKQYFGKKSKKNKYATTKYDYTKSHGERCMCTPCQSRKRAAAANSKKEEDSQKAPPLTSTKTSTSSAKEPKGIIRNGKVIMLPSGGITREDLYEAAMTYEQRQIDSIEEQQDELLTVDEIIEYGLVTDGTISQACATALAK